MQNFARTVYFNSFASNATLVYCPDNANTHYIIQHINNTIYAHVEDGYVFSDSLNYKGFEDEVGVEAFAIDYFNRKNEGQGEHLDDRLLVALVFTSFPNKDAVIGKVAYKLRFLDESYRTENLLPSSWETSTGPGYVPHSYENVFIGLQIMVDKTITNFYTSQQTHIEISMQAMPYPPYENSDNDEFYFTILPIFIIMGFIFATPPVIRIVVAEKETGVDELLCLMGLPKWMHWLGYMINAWIVLIPTITLVIVFIFLPLGGEAGALLINSNPTLWWLVLFLYITALTAFCFFLTSFFQKPALAITVGITVFIVSYVSIVFSLEEVYDKMNLATKLGLGLLPNMALHYAIRVMVNHELRNHGASWDKIGTGISSSDSLALYHMILMLIVDILIYVILTMYLQNVLPHPFGIRKPWYYIFLPSEWGIKLKYSEALVASNRASVVVQSDAFEKELPNISVGIDVQNLKKSFGRSKIAVDDLSHRFYKNEITALLGENGAGKTTTMSILTGMYGPTSGTAYVNGYSITNEMDKVREDMGLCPQHNMLFNRLTVFEHLMFFARLKGRSMKTAKVEAKYLLEKLKLEEKKNEFSASLSGGQKRKLSLACACITGTKTLILDEPTSGLDVENRRIVWDLLLEFRKGRTIILTTHFMEEADALGDRIAIMEEGKLVCFGTPMFLKKYYGTGYLLKLTRSNTESNEKILALIQKYVPESYVCKQSGVGQLELDIRIPTSKTCVFAPLLAELTSIKHELRVDHFSLAQTTMDDVFVRVGEINQEKSESNAGENNFNNDNNLEFETSSINKLSGPVLILQQLWNLLKKNIIYTYRLYGRFVMQLVFAVLLTIAAILTTNTQFSQSSRAAPRIMSLSDYNCAITPFTSQNDNLGSIYTKIIGDSATKVETGNLEEWFISEGTKDEIKYRNRYIIGATINSTNVKGMYSTIPRHTFPLSVNVISNMLLNHIDTTKSLNIEITNHPFTNELRESMYSFQKEYITIILSLIIPSGFYIFAASFVIHPLEERTCAAKQLQLMTGLNPGVYWLSFMLWDLLCIFVFSLAVVAFFPILEKHNFFTNGGGAGVALLIFITFGYMALPFSYLTSMVSRTVPGGFALLTIVHLLTGIGINMASFGTRNDPKLEAVSEALSWIGILFPSVGLSGSIMSYADVASTNVQCNIFPEKFRNSICSNSFNFGEDLRQCCAECGTPGYPECFKPTKFLTWKIGDHDAISPGVLQYLTYMFIVGTLFYVLLILIEAGIWQKARTMCSRAIKLDFKANNADPDVDDEKSRIDKIVDAGMFDKDALVISHLSKSFGNFPAVSHLNLGVHHGEVFGLLGVNGAGKTTTFKILSGDEVPSDGNAYSSKTNLRKNPTDFFKNIGYCPQFDGIVGVLTGNQMLELFAGLRGTPRSRISNEVNKWITKTGLKKSGNSMSKDYSGGMKRRLSSAMAMVGEPGIILLDEPTTGVDPVARREFWKTISSIRNAGQAILLTSHSMEECEKLCDRLAIMVNGELQCIGTVQHLKDKFAKGFCVTIRLKPKLISEIQMLGDLKTNFDGLFSPCVLKDEHQTMLQYHVTNPDLEWAVMFAFMEQLKQQYNDIIEDYSIGQTTLEEVFLSFARQQYPERKTNASKCFCMPCCGKREES